MIDLDINALIASTITFLSGLYLGATVWFRRKTLTQQAELIDDCAEILNDGITKDDFAKVVSIFKQHVLLLPEPYNEKYEEIEKAMIESPDIELSEIDIKQ